MAIFIYAFLCLLFLETSELIGRTLQFFITIKFFFYIGSY